MAGPVKWLESFWVGYDVDRDLSHMRERQRREKKLLTILDKIGFSWRIYAVAFLGFLASSWSLIAVGIVTPALYFVYPTNQVAANASVVLDEVTLAATVLGMLIFGRLADKYGRSALYGFELLIVLSAIGGAAFSSQGFMVVQRNDPSQYQSSMNIYAALFFWRFALGLGIGAEYPMSAVIAAEFTSTKHRATMLAGVFIAQPIGRLLAYALGLWILRGLTDQANIPNLDGETLQNKETLIMDQVWRLILGLAGIPAVFAIGLRLMIPETPRYFSAIKRDMAKAKEVIAKMGSQSPTLKKEDIETLQGTSAAGAPLPDEKETFWQKAMVYLFGAAKGWKPLAAISFQWFLLDVAFYGTGLDSPGTLAALWMDSKPPFSDEYYKSVPGFGVWNSDLAHPDARIDQTMDNNLTRTLRLSSVAAIAGSALVILLVNYQSRRTHYIWTSATLAVLFACLAISVQYTYQKPSHVASMVFYALIQFCFNLGPNTLTFIMAAESFPTEFRGTAFAVAAASGKTGAILARGLVEAAGKSRAGIVILLSVFSGVLFVMTLVAWIEPFGIAVPPAQRPRTEADDDAGLIWGRFRRLENLTLEDIAPWPVLPPPDAQVQASDSEAEESKTAAPQEHPALPEAAMPI